MKKIICGIVIAMCLCASVFSAPKAKAPTAEQLAAKGIEMMSAENGNKYPVYSVMNEPVKGKSYMCLSWNRTTEKRSDDNGFYNIMLHEVIKSTDEDSVEVNGTYIRFYPSLTVRINIDAVTLGDIIVFDSVETLFGKEWVTVQGPWDNWGYQTTDSDLGIEVGHRFKNHFAMVEKDLLEQKGIEFLTNYDGNKYLVYSTSNNLEEGKTYMCLSESKEKSISKDKNGFYGIYFYEVVDKSHPDAYKVGSKFVTSYPVACVWAKPNKKIKIPAEITFDGDVKFLFDMNWDIDESWDGWGWNTKDADLGLWICHKMTAYRLLEK